jgi:hypothetical protein
MDNIQYILIGILIAVVVIFAGVIGLITEQQNWETDCKLLGRHTDGRAVFTCALEHQ